MLQNPPPVRLTPQDTRRVTTKYVGAWAPAAGRPSFRLPLADLQPRPVCQTMTPLCAPVHVEPIARPWHSHDATLELPSTTPPRSLVGCHHM